MTCLHAYVALLAACVPQVSAKSRFHEPFEVTGLSMSMVE